MIDTIRFQIPLTETQHRAAIAFVSEKDTWLWAMHNPKSGDIVLRHYSGALPASFKSHHRELKFTVDPRYYPEKCFLTAEVSLPKFWYGHNINLLYAWQKALDELRNRFNKAFKLRTKAVLPPIGQWVLNRVDTCYSWRFPNQTTAQSFLDSLKVLRFPYKSPVIYPTSIFFKGSTYSLKFYLKHPEFRKHDLGKMVKQRISLEWIEHLEFLARGVLRIEATLRHKYLRRQGITTVEDLSRVHKGFLIDGFEPKSNREYLLAIEAVILPYWIKEPNREIPVGTRLELPPEIPEMKMSFGNTTVTVPGGTSITRQSVEMPTYIMQLLLKKFVGDSPKMRSCDKVEQALLANYKPVKAARLTAFWLYLRQFGADKAKASYGKNSYYTSISELKQAGVGMIEDFQVEDADRGFLDNFALEIPSRYVTNQFDDFRDSENCLNLPEAL